MAFEQGAGNLFSNFLGFTYNAVFQCLSKFKGILVG